MTEKMLDLRPGVGLSKLQDMNKLTLPELAIGFQTANVRSIRKDLFADLKADGLPKPLEPYNSVARVFK